MDLKYLMIIINSRFVFVIHRHGDRSPLMNYFQNTKYDAKYNEYWKSRVFIALKNLLGFKI